MKNIGIIGCGKIAQTRHIPEYMDNQDSRLAAFYDVNAERARFLAKKYGGRAYGTYRELLQDKEIDAVSVCVPNELHAQISIEALKAGKDVLCEKPMAVSLTECRQMVAAARESGKCLMIGQNQRLARGHVLAKQLIERGDIGRIITYRTTCAHGGPEGWSIDPGRDTWFFDKKKAAMGAMADLGIHKTDLIQYLLGEHVAEATAVMASLDKKDGSGRLIEVDDNAICIYKMESGVVGTMTASWTYYGQEDNSTVLYGTEGIMRIYEDPEYCIKIIKPGNDVILYNVDQIQTNDKQTRSGVIDAFVECIVQGKEPPISGSSVLSAMKAVFASMESAKTGKTIRIGGGE